MQTRVHCRWERGSRKTIEEKRGCFAVHNRATSEKRSRTLNNRFLNGTTLQMGVTRDDRRLLQRSRCRGAEPLSLELFGRPSTWEGEITEGDHRTGLHSNARCDPRQIIGFRQELAGKETNRHRLKPAPGPIRKKGKKSQQGGTDKNLRKIKNIIRKKSRQSRDGQNNLEGARGV